MAKLEVLTSGARVRGLAPSGIATVKTAEWFGDQCVQVLYLDDRGTAQQAILYRDDEARLVVEEKAAPWSFDADGDLLRLASRTRSVCEEMLPRQPMRCGVLRR